MNLSITNSHSTIKSLQSANASALSSQKKIASGSQYSSAGDNAAAYAILTRMYSNIGTTSQSNTNTQTMNSLLSTAAPSSLAAAAAEAAEEEAAAAAAGTRYTVASGFGGATVTRSIAPSGHSCYCLSVRSRIRFTKTRVPLLSYTSDVSSRTFSYCS